uniref:Ribosomal protein S10 n=1 Tax=Heterorhabditis bacteriophora TaxID=37862 RepID=A0A1I7WWW7_HETBA
MPPCAINQRIATNKGQKRTTKHMRFSSATVQKCHESDFHFIRQYPMYRVEMQLCKNAMKVISIFIRQYPMYRVESKLKRMPPCAINQRIATNKGQKRATQHMRFSSATVQKCHESDFHFIRQYPMYRVESPIKDSTRGQGQAFRTMS